MLIVPLNGLLMALSILIFSSSLLWLL